METAPVDGGAVARPPVFAPPDILWYFGGLVAAFAGDVLIGGTSPAHRGVWIFLVGLVLLAAFGALAAALIRLGLVVPGGVIATAAVLLVPPTEIGFERLFGVHPGGGGGSSRVTVGPVGVDSSAASGGFHGAIFSIAIGTVIVGAVVYGLVRFTFVLMPVTVALAISAELFLPAVVSHPSADDVVATALITGIVFCVVALLLDARLFRREAFWWYVVGLFEIAGAFVWYIGIRGHGWVWLLLLVVALAVLLASAPLQRASWAAYAVFGVYAAVVHYSSDWTGSWRTALVLTLAGLVLVALGVALDAAGGAVVTRVGAPWRLRRGR